MGARFVLKKRHPPVGARPGTLAIAATAAAPKIHRFTYTEDVFDEGEVKDVATLRESVRAGAKRWIHVQGLGDESLLREIESTFSIHPLALEDVVNVPCQPKAEVYDDHLLIIMRMAHGRGDEIVTEQVGLVLGRGHVLSFQEGQGDVFAAVRARLRSGVGRIRRAGVDYLAYALWDAIIDAFYPLVESLGEELEELEDEVMERPTHTTLLRLNRIKGSLLSLRRAIAPQREAVNMLIRDENPFVGAMVRTFLRDVYDHCVQTAEAIDAAREMVNGLMNMYLSVVSNRTNEVMKVLTIVASIFVPLTFMAGIYGMNFEFMPELHHRAGYPLLLVTMLGVAAGLILYFRHKGWIGSKGDEDDEE